MQKITFITHSCFLVELDTCQLLFDYFDFESIPNAIFHGKQPEFDLNKKLYIFSSHHHKDHFSLEVLKWQGIKHPDITYVLSKDIRLGRNYLIRNDIDLDIKKRIKFVSAENSYKIDDIKVETLRSTDEGVAFIVEADGQRIYHAGDLHWWCTTERGELYTEVIGKNYKKELKHIGERHIDFAFVVLDPRMGDNYALGLDYFLKTIECDLVFPMHMWNEFDLIERFKRRPETLRFANKVVDIDRENIIFTFEN